MNASQLAFMVVRVVAFFVGLQSLALIIGLVSILSSVESEVLHLMKIVYLISLGCIVLLAVSTWFKAPYFGKKIIEPSLSGDEKVSNFNADDLLRIAVVVVGFYFLAKAIHPFSMIVGPVFYLLQSGKDIPYSTTLLEDFIECAIFAGIGLYLIFTSRGFALFLNKLRGRA